MTILGESIAAEQLNRLIGRDCVVDADGRRLGRLRHVYDDQAGEPSWVTVTHGPNRPTRFVPLQDARIDRLKLRLGYPMAVINTSPEVADDDVIESATERRLSIHYGLVDVDSAESGAVMIRSEERLRIGTAVEVSERILIHKYIVTEEVTHTFTLRREEFRIEYQPFQDTQESLVIENSTGEVFTGEVFADEVEQIVLYAEVPVLQPRVVPVEIVRIEKRTVSETEDVSAELEREQIELEQTGNSPSEYRQSGPEHAGPGRAAPPVGRQTSERPTGTDQPRSTMSQSIDTSASRNAPVRSDLEDNGSHATQGNQDVSWKDNILGNARSGRVHNVSWGAIFAGVVTFLAIAFVFSLLTAAFGLDGSGGGAAVVSIMGVLIAFFGAGGVAGAMAVRGGLIHGFLTWATSILATVVLVVVLTLGTAGAVGGVLGSVLGGLGAAAGPSLSQVQPADIPNPTAAQRAQAEQAQQQAQQAAQQAADASRTGATWGFFGLLLGGVVSSIGGLLGSRSVYSREATRSDATSRTAH